MNATYCPEDNKLRLYVGRVPRDEYLALKAQGWTSTPKQSCDFVATWTPERRDMCLKYADCIEDEDQTPEERAADRAERFGDYRDKRTSEAVGHADRYDSGPQAHGYQSQARAERMAARHNRIADHATDAWSKAEYWQRRTAGVISHALHKSTPAVRMGRIKELEAALRKYAAQVENTTRIFNNWKQIAAIEDETKKTEAARRYSGRESCGMWGDFKHPRNGKEYHCLYSMLDSETDPITGAEACALFFEQQPEPAQEGEWSLHYRLRLAYENQMLEAQGGRAAFVEMVPGGWIGNHQIRKVNKSNATGRVVSVTLKVQGDRWGNSKEGFHMHPFNIERLSVDSYRAPTQEDLDKLAADIKAEKAAAPKKEKPPLINPTDADAERIQAIWNAEALEKCPDYMRKDFKPSTVRRIPQSVYSANSKGTYARAETANICRGGVQEPTYYSYDGKLGPVMCQVRTTYGDGNTSNKADSVIVLTDKPQKPLPAKVWEPLTVAQPEQVPA